MAELTARKAALLGGLVAMSPDAVLERLSTALADAHGDMGAVAAAVGAERTRRRRMAQAFGAVGFLFSPPRPPEQGPAFAPALRDRLWARLERLQPGLVRRLDREHGRAIAADGLCGAAADLLRERAEGLGADDEATLDDLATYLDLAHLTRDLADRLPSFMARGEEDAATAYRLLLKDARAVHPDGVRRILEMAAALSPGHPASVLKLVVQVRPNAHEESVLIGSELSIFVDRLMDAAEVAAARARALDPRRTDEAGALEAARRIALASEIVAEIGLAIDLRPGGAWAARHRAIRQGLSDHASGQMKLCADAIDQALPLVRTTLAGSMTRLAPDLMADPDSEAVGLARRRLLFMAGLRSSAAVLGCAALKASIGETLTERLGDYAIEAIDRLNDREDETVPGAGRRLIEAAADFLALLGDDQMAQTVRRRLISALDRPGSIQAA